MIALDASALLALLFREEGHERVAAELHHGCMTTVNLAEVLGRFARDGHSTADVLAELRTSPIEWVAFDHRLAVVTADLLPLGLPFGLSFGDRACIALGKARAVPVLTADRAWVGLDVGVEIRCIRESGG